MFNPIIHINRNRHQAPEFVDYGHGQSCDRGGLCFLPNFQADQGPRIYSGHFCRFRGRLRVHLEIAQVKRWPHSDHLAASQAGLHLPAREFHQVRIELAVTVSVANLVADQLPENGHYCRLWCRQLLY